MLIYLDIIKKSPIKHNHLLVEPNPRMEITTKRSFEGVTMLHFDYKPANAFPECQLLVNPLWPLMASWFFLHVSLL